MAINNGGRKLSQIECRFNQVSLYFNRFIGQLRFRTPHCSGASKVTVAGRNFDALGTLNINKSSRCPTLFSIASSGHLSVIVEFVPLVQSETLWSAQEKGRGSFLRFKP
jgi:hypothetical protein